MERPAVWSGVRLAMRTGRGSGGGRPVAVTATASLILVDVIRCARPLAALSAIVAAAADAADSDPLTAARRWDRTRINDRSALIPIALRIHSCGLRFASLRFASLRSLIASGRDGWDGGAIREWGKEKGKGKMNGFSLSPG